MWTRKQAGIDEASCFFWLVPFLLLGCSEPSSLVASDGGPPDAEQDSPIDRASLFWSAFAIEGEWVEFHPTLAAMARRADIVAVATVSEVASRVIQGSDPTTTSEAVLTLDIEDAVRGGDNLASLTLTLTPGYRLSEASVDTLNDLLPIDPILVLVRERTDEPGSYVLVNGYGLWAQTERGDVDCPVVVELTDDVCLYREELMGVDSVQELAEQLRQ